MRKTFALLTIVTALVAAPSCVDADTLKFAWWKLNTLTAQQIAENVLQGNVDQRTAVLSAAGVDVMAGCGLCGKQGGDFAVLSNGYRVENGKTLTNGSADADSRTFAVAGGFDVAVSTNAATPMIFGAKNLPATNATALWSVISKDGATFVFVSAAVGSHTTRPEQYPNDFMNGVAGTIATATNGIPDAVVVMCVLDNSRSSGVLTSSAFAAKGFYCVRDGSSGSPWILCSDSAMAASAASTVAELPSATEYGTAGYTAVFTYSGNVAGGDEILVGTAAEFSAAVSASTPAGQVMRLTKDINLSGWTTCDFAGTLDGAGFSVSGLSLPLFGTLTGSVRNLTIAGSTIAGEEKEECIGFFARKVRDTGAISGCTAASDCTLTFAGQSNCHVGGIAGMLETATGDEGSAGTWITDCTNLAKIVCSAPDFNTRHGVGGIVGVVSNGVPCASGVERCLNRGQFEIGTSCMGIGGIAGRLFCGGTAVDKSIVIADCRNESAIAHGKDDDTQATRQFVAGGIVGGIGSVNLTYFGTCEITRCANFADVAAGDDASAACATNRYAGGIVGRCEALRTMAEVRVRDSANYGDVSGRFAGGFLGYMTMNRNYAASVVEISNCAGYGAVSWRASGALAVGGTTEIAANRTRTINNCFFAAAASVPLVAGEDAAAYEATGVIRSGDPGYSPEGAAASLTAGAMDVGLSSWTSGILPDGTTSAPLLVPFCERRRLSGSQIIFRGWL